MSSTVRAVVRQVLSENRFSSQELTFGQLRFLASRGLRKILMGTPLALTHRGIAFPLFRGSNVVIRYANRIRSGPGLHLSNGCLIDCYGDGDVEFGRRVTLRENVWLQVSSSFDNGGMGVRIGDNTYVGPGCILGAGGFLDIGANCQFGAYVTFSTESHVTEDSEIFGAGVTRSGIRVEDDVWIGNGAHILDGVVLGAGCVVGAGSVVTASVPARSVVAGVPARVIRTRAAT